MSQDNDDDMQAEVEETVEQTAEEKADTPAQPEPVKDVGPTDLLDPAATKAVIDQIVHGELNDIPSFHIDGSKEWSQKIGNDVKEKLKDMGKDPNYKYWVSVVIGELKGQGVEIGTSCAWNPYSDKVISTWFANDFLYWFVIVFAVFRAPKGEDDLH